jgi:uncharacterized protein (DUF1800 family)
MADFTRGDVAHLLRRAGFSSTPDEVDALVGEPSWSAVVDRVLDTSANPPDPMPAAVGNLDDQRAAAIAAVRWWMDRMVTTPTPLVEKLTFFWHGILTSAIGPASPQQLFEQLATYRRLGLGDLETLMQAMAIDPAMLQYLDGANNNKVSPNENFARELMELFTMGNFTFTEDDVKALARAWTGHNLQASTGQYVFRGERHDYGQKTLFGITKNWNGPQALTEILRGSKQPVSARYLAGRIWSFFAAPNPAPALLDELRDAFIDADLNVAAFLRYVFEHPDFRSAATKTGLVRSPVEWVVALLRSTGIDSDQLDLVTYLPRMGQIPMLPPNVSGWRQNRAWISSSTVWAKGSVAGQVQLALDAAGTFDDLASLSVAGAVAATFERLGIDAPSAATRSDLEAYLSAERAAGRGATATSTLPAITLLTPDFQLA